MNTPRLGVKAEFTITGVLKGPQPALTKVAYDEPEIITIGCTASDGFRNAFVEEGKTYLIYVAQGRLLRAGDKEREWPEIAWAEETRIARRASAPNKSLERTRER